MKTKNIRDMEGIEMMANFAGAWVKYGMLMLYVLFSSVAYLVKKFSGEKE